MWVSGEETRRGGGARTGYVEEGPQFDKLRGRAELADELDLRIDPV